MQVWTGQLTRMEMNRHPGPPPLTLASCNQAGRSQPQAEELMLREGQPDASGQPEAVDATPAKPGSSLPRLK